jgi:hypothetical protein
MKILLYDFNANVGRENNFRAKNGNESLHEISNDKGVRVVKLPHLKTSNAEYSLIATFINTPGPLLRERHKSLLITFW